MPTSPPPAFRQARFLAYEGLAIIIALTVVVLLVAFHLPAVAAWAVGGAAVVGTGFWFRKVLGVLEKNQEMARRYDVGLHKLVDFDPDVVFLSWDEDSLICQYAGGGAATSGVDAKKRMGTSVEVLFAERGGEPLFTAYERVRDCLAAEVTCEFDVFNPLSGELDTWYARLFMNDVPGAGYAHFRRINEEKRQRERAEKFSIAKDAADQRFDRLASVAEANFYSSTGNGVSSFPQPGRAE